MEILLLRHAEAEARSLDSEDARRGLTRKGRARFARGVEGLARLGVSLGRVYHSPWLRAVESAELLVPILDGETVVTPHLAEAPGPGLLDALEGERIALVGHEPWLSDLLGWLVFGIRVFEPPGRPEFLEFDKAAVAWLIGRPEPGGMALRAFLPSRTLRRLAR